MHSSQSLASFNNVFNQTVAVDAAFLLVGALDTGLQHLVAATACIADKPCAAVARV